MNSEPVHSRRDVLNRNINRFQTHRADLFLYYPSTIQYYWQKHNFCGLIKADKCRSIFKIQHKGSEIWQSLRKVRKVEENNQ